MLGSISAPWLDHLYYWVFVAMFPLALAVAAVMLPLRRTWLYESRQWPEDRQRRYMDEVFEPNKTGESFGPWLTRNGHHRSRMFARIVWPVALFVFVWPAISKDFCSITKCKGRPAPAAISSP